MPSFIPVGTAVLAGDETRRERPILIYYRSRLIRDRVHLPAEKCPAWVGKLCGDYLVT